MTPPSAHGPCTPPSPLARKKKRLNQPKEMRIAKIQLRSQCTMSKLSVLASFVILQLCASSSSTVVIQNGKIIDGTTYCLKAGGSAADRLSFVLTDPCNSTDSSQHWTYDSEGTGKICSTSVGGCLRHSDPVSGRTFLRYGFGQAQANPVVVLALSKQPVDSWPEHTFAYNPTNMALNVKGICSSLLDSVDNIGLPVYIHTNSSGCVHQLGVVCDCNSPLPQHQWTFISV